MFSSVITGNLVLLGLSAATLSASLAVHSGVALAGCSAGVLAGAPIAARCATGAGPWPPSVTLTLLVEFAVLAVFSAGWESTGLHPAGTAQLLLITALAGAVIGGLVTGHAPGWLPAVILMPLAAVVIILVAGFPPVKDRLSPRRDR